MRVIILCHTELGYASGKTIHFGVHVRGAVHNSVRRIIQVADKYNAKICFATEPQVATEMPSIGNHSIGLHLHPDDARLIEAGVGGKLPLREYDDKQKMSVDASKATQLLGSRRLTSPKEAIDNIVKHRISLLGSTQ